MPTIPTTTDSPGKSSPGRADRSAPPPARTDPPGAERRIAANHRGPARRGRSWKYAASPTEPRSAPAAFRDHSVPACEVVDLPAPASDGGRDDHPSIAAPSAWLASRPRYQPRSGRPPAPLSPISSTSLCKPCFSKPRAATLHGLRTVDSPGRAASSGVPWLSAGSAAARSMPTPAAVPRRMITVPAFSV